MPSSYRIDPHLARRLREVAARQAVPVSAVVREAIALYCDTVLAADARARLADVIGVFQSDGGRASRSGRAFKDVLGSRRRR
jgi:predicted transcriptional regulator